MAGKVPVAAGVLSIVGAVFILIGGLAEAYIGAILSIFFPGVGAILVAGALGVAVLSFIWAILMFVMPSHKAIWGALMIVMAVLSLPFAFLGGFLIGFILALIGGILAITYKAPEPPVVVYAPMPGAPPFAPPPPPPPPPM